MSLKALKGLVLALTVAGLAAPALADAPASVAVVAKARPDPNLIVPDPAIRRGVLPNGLRYMIMRNNGPKGMISIRLGIGAGSYEERDEERGLAHFVEHMAFEGSRNFPDGKIDQVFAPRGVAFGRDQNAFTTMRSTTFYLDLLQPDPALIDMSFRWMRDVADGITFSPEAVEREKGIVLAEKEARSDAGDDAQEKVSRFEAGSLRSVDRAPIGTPESIRTATAERLRGFYDHWYRPDNAVMVVVGDAPIEEMERRVKAGFSSWVARAPAPVRAPTTPLDLKRGLDSLVVADPHFPTVLSVCRLRAADPILPDDVAKLRRQAMTRIWRNVLDARLDRLTTGGRPPFLSASFVMPSDAPDMSGVCLATMAINDDWQVALQAAQAEMRRFAAEGPTDAEMENAIESLRAGYRGEASRTNTRQTNELATQLMTDGLYGVATPTPREALRAFDVAVEGLTPEDVRAGFTRDWSGAGPFLALMAPAPQDKSLLLAAWNRGEKAAPLGKYLDATAVRWAYPMAAQPGKVAKREVVAEGDFVRLTWRNGVVLNFKRVSSVKNEVQARVRFGAGRREIPNDRFFTAVMAAQLFQYGGLGKHDYGQVEGLFQNGGWGATLAIRDDAFVMSGQTTAGSLDDELQVLAAYLTDPGFSPKVDALLPTAIEAVYRSYRTVPAAMLGYALVDAVAPGSPAAMPPREVLASMRSTDFAALLRPAVTKSPIEVTIAGDIEEQKVVDLVSRTLGAMPPRGPRDAARKDAWFLRFPDHPYEPIQTTPEGAPDKPIVGAIWPLYVATPDRRREEMAVYIVAKVMNDRLLHRVRQQLGKTYAPSVDTMAPDKADQGYMLAAVEAYPADIDEVAVEIRKAADQMAGGDITAEDLEQARKPLLSSVAAAREAADWWADALDGSARDGDHLAFQLHSPELLASITLDEVRKAAADWLVKPPIVVIARPAGARQTRASR
jgi:zinc protease